MILPKLNPVYKKASIKKKDESFDDIFGDFKVKGCDNVKQSTITYLDEQTTNSCNHCGCRPRLHNVCFKDTETYKKHFYIDCDCCINCDGEWYETEEDAIDAWNRNNPEKSVAIDTERVKQHQFISKILDDVRF